MSEASSQPAFERAVFTTPRARLERFTDAILEHLPRDRALRLLDLGCGTGEQLFHILAALPRATGVGVDVSPQSIQLAEADRARRPEGPRAEFLLRNYLDYGSQTSGEAPLAFDAIVSYSVLYVVPGTTEALVAKLARDLVSGGVIVNCMPVACLSNSLLALGRRCLRLLRGRALEGLALFVARRLYRNLDEALLRERIPYLYVVPERYEGAAFQRAARDAGLDVVLERAEPRASFAQLRHRLVVYSKTPPRA